MTEKNWTAYIDMTSDDTVLLRERPKLSIEGQIAHMRDEKGIKFNIVTEEQAAHFLSNSNYYFKIKAFAKNYSKYKNGDNAGKYYNLEFAYLQELSTLDMYLREIILNITLNIEHFLKVHLLRDISKNEKEDGYQIVEQFLSWHPEVRDRIDKKAKDSYCEDLIEKYKKRFPVWAFVEVLSFGDLINFCDCYYQQYPSREIHVGDLKIAKFLRNACAHNNCLINDLSNNSNRHFTQNRSANRFVASINDISANVRNKKMGNRTVHDFVVTLCCFNTITTSIPVKKFTLRKLQDLLSVRFTLNKDFFSDNALLCSNYRFIKKVVDKMAELYI